MFGCSLVMTKIGMLMFLMNWPVVCSSSVDPHSLAFAVHLYYLSISSCSFVVVVAIVAVVSVCDD